MFDWLANHPELILPLLVSVTLLIYGSILGIPSLRTRFLHRLPCVTTHAVHVEIDLSDPATIERSMNALHGLTSHARWSPAPPSYHVRTTTALTDGGALRWKETVVTATTYHLWRNRSAAEIRLADYLESVSREVANPN